jgi:hypothetical protein
MQLSLLLSLCMLFVLLILNACNIDTLFCMFQCKDIHLSLYRCFHNLNPEYENFISLFHHSVCKQIC